MKVLVSFHVDHLLHGHQTLFKRRRERAVVGELGRLERRHAEYQRVDLWVVRDAVAFRHHRPVPHETVRRR